MKILHLCLGCFYVDNYSYQENMLPKYHKEMGHDVEIVASTLSFDENGNGCNIEPGVYKNEYGIQVTRLPYAKWAVKKVGRFFRLYRGTYDAILNAKPDLIFIHGCQFCDMRFVKRYVKTHKCKVYVDNHADFSNSATNWLSRKILHGLLWRHYAHIIEPYTSKFYGVLPVRVDFLKNIYKLPPEKCELLVMGADDDLVSSANNDGVREAIRKKYRIKSDDFLIMTGGKIDQWKKQTFLLMEAVKEIKSDRVKLIVFGSVINDLKGIMKSLVDETKIQYIGWIQAKDSYNLFAASDLVVFPGRHSVMWEQVAAQGIPMIVKKWDGTMHVDVGGNVIFLEKDSKELIQMKIEYLLDNIEEYNKMKHIAVEKGKNYFSYRTIARRAIEESYE